MEWRDEGLVIGVRTHGETSAVVELMTRHHGRHAGVVRGARSRTMRPILQAGNSVAAHWRARLHEHVGTLTVEGTVLRTAAALASGLALDTINYVAALLRLLPERDPHLGLYDGAILIADRLENAATAAALIVRFEVELLAELGFGLDLNTCAATGITEDLAYVSPRTGRAVSRAAGSPYHDRLFALPEFLRPRLAQQMPSHGDILAGFALTGHFLVRNVFDARGLAMPDARRALINRVDGAR